MVVSSAPSPSAVVSSAPSGQASPAPRSKDAALAIEKKWLRSRKKAERSADGKGVCTVDVAYPVVSGAPDAAADAKMNKTLLEIRRGAGAGPPDDPCIGPDKVTGDYTVHLNRSGVLSVSFQFSDYCTSCAHPSAGGAAVNLLVETGAPIPLGKVLAPGGAAKLRKVVEKAVRPRVMADAQSAQFLDQLLDAYLEGDYVLTEEGLRVIAYYRLPHVIQALDGEVGVTAAYDKLSGALDPKSPAAAVWAGH